MSALPTSSAGNARTPRVLNSPGSASLRSASTVCAASAGAQTLPPAPTSCAAAVATAPSPSPPPARSGRASSPAGSRSAIYWIRIWRRSSPPRPSRPLRPPPPPAGPKAAARARLTTIHRARDPLGDHLGALDCLGTGGVDLDVVAHPAVHQLGLHRGHPGDPIAAGELTARRHLGVAPDP